MLHHDFLSCVARGMAAMGQNADGRQPSTIGGLETNTRCCENFFTPLIPPGALIARTSNLTGTSTILLRHLEQTCDRNFGGELRRNVSNDAGAPKTPVR